MRSLGIRLTFYSMILLASATANAGFMGNTIHADHRFPDSGSVFSDFGNAVVDAGVEYGVAGSRNNLAFDISDLAIRIFDPDGSSITFAGAAFNGFTFDDVFSSIAPIVGLTIDASTTLAGFSASRLSFSAEQLLVNFESLQFTAGQQLVLNVQFGSQVPTPATLALFGLGLAGLGWSRRKKV